MSLVSSTFDKFHEWAIERNICYSVLRNYENLPDVGNDLDLAMRKKDVDAFRIALKENLFDGWDYITEVTTHNSSFDLINIAIFRFYSVSTKEFVQFDFFQGFSILGQEYFDIEALLTNRRLVGKYFIVSLAVENLIKYMQVYTAIKLNQKDRIKKYSTLLIQNGRCDYLSRMSLTDNTLQRLLQQEDYNGYRSLIDSGRRRFLVARVKTDFTHFVKSYIFKLKYIYRIYFGDPFSVSISLPESIDKAKLYSILDLMVEMKLVRSYINFAMINFLRWRFIKDWLMIRSHGGFVVTFSGEKVLPISQEKLAAYIFENLVQNEKLILKTCL